MDYQHSAFGQPKFDVLVIEDSQDDEMLTLRGLMATGLPIRVKVARDGQEGLEILGIASVTSQEPPLLPKIVFVDLKMPRVGGIDFLRAARNHPATAKIPIVCMSSSDDESDISTCHSLGTTSYILKPLDFATYVSVIQKAAEYWLGINRFPAPNGGERYEDE